MENKSFSIGKTNILLIGVGFIIIVLGFLLMTGPASGAVFNPDILSIRRITIGPMVALFGFLSIIFAILYKPKAK
jgi:Protein of unknown function (DUF3098)